MNGTFNNSVVIAWWNILVGIAHSTDWSCDGERLYLLDVSCCKLFEGMSHWPIYLSSYVTVNHRFITHLKNMSFCEISLSGLIPSFTVLTYQFNTGTRPGGDGGTAATPKIQICPISPTPRKWPYHIIMYLFLLSWLFVAKLTVYMFNMQLSGIQAIQNANFSTTTRPY